jgi:hypothetical protein
MSFPTTLRQIGESSLAKSPRRVSAGPGSLVSPSPGEESQGQSSPKCLNTGLDSRIACALLKQISLVKMKLFSTASFEFLLVKGRPVDAEDAVALLEKEEGGGQPNTARATRDNGGLLRSHVSSRFAVFLALWIWY